jgi:hypothetical protein
LCRFTNSNKSTVLLFMSEVFLRESAAGRGDTLLEADTTGVPLKTVKNVLTGLRKQGVVDPTGQTEGQAERVRLSVPRPDAYRDGTRDTGIIQSERQVFEMAREHFGLEERGGAA